MAIPFLLPSDDEAEVQGQELEQLMLALYAALQQVLRNRNDQHPSRNRELNDLLKLVCTFLEIFLRVLVQMANYPAQ